MISHREEDCTVNSADSEEPAANLHTLLLPGGDVGYVKIDSFPAEYEDKTAQLRREVEAQLQDGKKVYHLVITFDTAAFNKMTKEAQG